MTKTKPVCVCGNHDQIITWPELNKLLTSYLAIDCLDIKQEINLTTNIHDAPEKQCNIIISKILRKIRQKQNILCKCNKNCNICKSEEDLRNNLNTVWKLVPEGQPVQPYKSPLRLKTYDKLVLLPPNKPDIDTDVSSEYGEVDNSSTSSEETDDSDSSEDGDDGDDGDDDNDDNDNNDDNDKNGDTDDSDKDNNNDNNNNNNDTDDEDDEDDADNDSDTSTSS
jgi:hypothetical protein